MTASFCLCYYDLVWQYACLKKAIMLKQWCLDLASCLKSFEEGLCSFLKLCYNLVSIWFDKNMHAFCFWKISFKRGKRGDKEKDKIKENWTRLWYWKRNKCTINSFLRFLWCLGKNLLVIHVNESVVILVFYHLLS